jgi:rod shape-determining protein MreB
MSKGPDESTTVALKGRCVYRYRPESREVPRQELREAVGFTILPIVRAVRACLDRTPPEMSADLCDGGITLTGGAARLRGLDLHLSRETSLPVKICAEPAHAVARGLERLLSDSTLLSRVAIGES